MGKSPSPTWAPGQGAVLGSRNLGEPPGPRLPCCLCIVVTQQWRWASSAFRQVSGVRTGARGMAANRVPSLRKWRQQVRPCRAARRRCRGGRPCTRPHSCCRLGLASVPPVLPRTWVALPMPKGADVEGFSSSCFGAVQVRGESPCHSHPLSDPPLHPPAWPNGLTLPLLTPASLPP